MYKIIDTITIIGLEKFDDIHKLLNAISISVTNNELIGYLALSTKYKCRFCIKGLLFTAAFTNNTQVIHLITNGIADAQTGIINGKDHKILGQINLYEIENWHKIRKKDTWIYAPFHKPHVVYAGKHFANEFITATLTDLLNFDVSLIDDQRKLIEFALNQKKSYISFFYYWSLKMIKVKQHLSSITGSGNKELEKIKNELIDEFKILYATQDKLEKENKVWKQLIEQAKIEYQNIYNSNTEQKDHINYYRQYTENLLQQIKKLEKKINDLENKEFCYSEPVVKRPQYREDFNENNKEEEEIEKNIDLDVIEKTPPKKTRKVGISKYIKQ